MEILNFALAVIAVLVAPAASLLTLRANNRNASENAEKERVAVAKRAKEDRLFEAREARYEERKAAALDLALVFEREVDEVDRFMFDNEYGSGTYPGDIWPDREFGELSVAATRLRVVADAEVAGAAENLREAVFDRFFGRKPKPGTAVEEARANYYAACRRMLASDLWD